MAEPSLAQDMVAPPVHLHRAPQPVVGVALGDAGVAQDTPEPEETHTGLIGQPITTGAHDCSDTDFI